VAAILLPLTRLRPRLTQVLQHGLASDQERRGSRGGVAERFRHIIYDQCIEEELCFLGPLEQVIAQIRRLDRQIGGLKEMVIISNFGGIEPWKAIKTQELFAKYVIPALRE
jgi:hypothetical protein